jgi:hypothetical protein
MKPCECGCGELIQEANRNGPLHYKFGHNRKGLWWYEGRPHTTLGKKRPDASIKMTLHNPNKRAEVGLGGLHDRIRKRLPKPELCQSCNKERAYDLANVSDKYLEDLSDWEWLCRRCHMRKDGRMSNLNRTKVMILNGAST